MAAATRTKDARDGPCQCRQARQDRAGRGLCISEDTLRKVALASSY
jgi:hypothetical protein